MGIFGTDYRNRSDEVLMKYVAKGDPKAFEVIYDRYAERLMNYFHRMLWRDREKAQDFMQDLFTKVLAKPDRYDPSRPFKTWLYSVANNMCKNEYEKHQVRKGGPEVLTEHSAPPAPETITEGIDWARFQAELDRELEKLDEKHRTAFVLRYRDELSIREISQVFQCSEGTVKSRLFYALKKLAPKLEAWHPKRNPIDHG